MVWRLTTGGLRRLVVPVLVVGSSILLFIGLNPSFMARCFSEVVFPDDATSVAASQARTGRWNWTVSIAVAKDCESLREQVSILSYNSTAGMGRTLNSPQFSSRVVQCSILAKVSVADDVVSQDLCLLDQNLSVPRHKEYLLSL